MSNARWVIVLIEDDKKKAAELEKAFAKELDATFAISRFTGKAGESGTYEDRLLKSLGDAHHRNLALIVTDRDLSTLPTYPGLSESTISSIASQLSVPLCTYASGKPASFLERWKNGGMGRVILDSSDTKAMARKVKIVASGFRQLHGLVADIEKSRGDKKYSGPAMVLAHLLEVPEIVDQFALYARGDQRMIDSLKLRATESTEVRGGVDVARRRQVSLALGGWLYDSIMRFPGILVNRVAAGSFLGIEPRALARQDVAVVFKKALYKGPFSDEAEPYWWRHRLTELQTAAGVDARSLVTRKTGVAPRVCRCVVDGKAPAGFVCVMTEEPVCGDHSVAQVSWLPRGANLSRVKTDVFDQIGPWLGMS